MTREYEKYGIYQNADEDEHGVVFEYGDCYNTMYISSVYERTSNNQFVHGGFNERTFDELDFSVTGFVLSDNTHSGGSIDHAPDVTEPMIGMGLIPDGIDVVVSMDRRGHEMFASKLLEVAMEKGAKILWDGADEIEAVFPCKSFRFKRANELSWCGDVVYDGDIDERHANAYVSAVLTASAELCREEYELAQIGATFKPRCICETSGELLSRAVDVISLGRITFPEDAKCTYYDAVARALDDRRVEMARQWAEVAEGVRKALFIAACPKIWQEAHVKSGKYGAKIRTDRRIKDAARRAGVEHMLDALEQGVPIEDILA